MNTNQSVRDVQLKILEIMKYIDRICRQHSITYYIMGGTALGAIRHGGFIPWDDDLDIFMTPTEYNKFKDALKKDNNPSFYLQEWKTTPNYLEYAKIRMNNTTFIEEAFKDRKDMHHGIYVDIMMLHKVPDNLFLKKLVYFESKFVQLYALTQRNWKAKSISQQMTVALMKVLPCKWLAKLFYARIFKYDELQDGFMYCYWLTPAKYRSGIFETKFFEEPIDIPFEDTFLYGSKYIKEYLEYRYGDYMKMPSIEQQRAAVHAMIYDINKDYSEYL